MRYFQYPDGHVQGFDAPTLEQVDGAAEITADQFAQIATTPVITAAMAQAALVAAAKSQLDLITGTRGQFSRAQVAGILPNDTQLAPWQAHVQALRAIASGADTTSTKLPATPTFIPGT